jgi:ubiquinone/menaquinone biosynthesis C-methylase UbiE
LESGYGGDSIAGSNPALSAIRKDIMKDQRVHWNNAHKNQWLHSHSQHQTGFAEEVNRAIKPRSKILELGCGEGNDSIYFAEQGHVVTATDFSDEVIKQNKQRHANSSLKFLEQDNSQKLPFEDNSFDIVYARLSLHYFTDKTTRAIFEEIKRVLRPNGKLYFMCKSTDDPIHGKGKEIEADMFELDDHVRHFFSRKYVLSLLDNTGWSIESLTEGKEVIYDRVSAFIKVCIRKD